MKALIPVLLALVLAPAAVAVEQAPKRFGPFDAGEVRPVTRQGQKGKARHAHPAVGAADKVPGEGPPKPALHLDPSIPEDVRAHGNHVGKSLSSNPLFLAALIYSNILTKADGPRCQHYPTCSRFAYQAVAKYGPLGILMGLDRIIQPGDSSAVRHLPDLPMDENGIARHYDPVENYEWWKKRNFSGFPKKTKEQPLALPPLSTTTAPSAP